MDFNDFMNKFVYKAKEGRAKNPIFDNSKPRPVEDFGIGSAIK